MSIKILFKNVGRRAIESLSIEFDMMIAVNSCDRSLFSITLNLEGIGLPGVNKKSV